MCATKSDYQIVEWAGWCVASFKEQPQFNNNNTRQLDDINDLLLLVTVYPSRKVIVLDVWKAWPWMNEASKMLVYEFAAKRLMHLKFNKALQDFHEHLGNKIQSRTDPQLSDRQDKAIEIQGQSPAVQQLLQNDESTISRKRVQKMQEKDSQRALRRTQEDGKGS